MKKTYLPLLANLTSEVLLGFSYLFMKMGLRMLDNDAPLFLMLRYTICFTTVCLLAAFKVIKIQLPRRAVGLLFLMGFLNTFLAQFCKTSSTIYVHSSRIAMFNSLMPLAMILLGVLLNREMPTRKQALFVSMTVVGVFIANIAGAKGSASHWVGYLFVAGFILSNAVAKVLMRRTSLYYGPSDIAFYSLFVAFVGFNMTSIPSVVGSSSLERHLATLTQPEMIAILLYTSIGTNVAVLFLTSYATARLPFAVYSSTCTISTVIIILSGVFILKEPFALNQLVGMVIILTGVIGNALSYEKKDNRLKLNK